MARNNNDDEFLGGGVAFNKVGNHPTGDEVAKIDETGLKPHHIRRILSVVAVIALALVLYLVGEAGLIPGIQHVHGDVRHRAVDSGHGFEGTAPIDVDKPLSPSGP
jgi:hypothetical protein